MNWGDIIRQAAPGFITLQGAGGDRSVIWALELQNSRVHQLSTVDFSSVRFGSNGSSKGVGGSSDVIYTSDYEGGDRSRYYELSTVDFSVVLTSDQFTGSAGGIGGSVDKIHANILGIIDYEVFMMDLSTVDLSVIFETLAPDYVGRGCGGDNNVCWYIPLWDNDNQLYSLSPSDYSVVKFTDCVVFVPGDAAQGLGGKGNVMWCSRGHYAEPYDMFYERYVMDIEVAVLLSTNF